MLENVETPTMYHSMRGDSNTGEMPGYGQGTQISRTGSSNSNSSSSNEVLGQSGYFPQQQYMVPQPMLSRTSQAGYYYYYQPAMVQMPQQAPLPQLAPAQHLAPLPQMLRPIQPLAMSPPAQPASRSNSNTSSGPQPVPRKARRGTGDGHLANPRMITTMWEDERTLCYQVEANGVSVVRRADNDMINGTKLLNVTKMTRGRRDGILRGEKVRTVVKIGSMHLKGVWIPFERAYLIAEREKIFDLLYPLFVKDIKGLLKQMTPTYIAPQMHGASAAAAASGPDTGVTQNSTTLPGIQFPQTGPTTEYEQFTARNAALPPIRMPALNTPAPESPVTQVQPRGVPSDKKETAEGTDKTTISVLMT